MGSLREFVEAREICSEAYHQRLRDEARAACYALPARVGFDGESGMVMFNCRCCKDTLVVVDERVHCAWRKVA